MANFTIDLSGRRGLATRWWGDLDRTVSTPNLRYLADEGQMVAGTWNPFRRYGYLSPANGGFTSIDISTISYTEVPASVLYDDVQGEILFAERGQKIGIANGGLDDTQLYINDTADLGSTGTPTIYDLEMYQVDGVRKVFAIYEKSGNLYRGYWSAPLSSAGAVTEAAVGDGISLNRTAFMRVADNGFAYIFSDSNIHKFDGTTDGGTSGTETANVIVFPVTFTITDAVDWRGYFWVAINQSAATTATLASTQAAFNAPCGVYVWDRQSTVVSTTDFIPMYGARTIKVLYTTQLGTLRAMVINSEGVTEIREYDGNAFQVICEVGRGYHPNYHDSVTQDGALTIWFAATGDIMMHGSIAPGEKEGLYKIGPPPASSITAGAVFFGGASGSAQAGYKSFRSGLILGYTTSDGTTTMKQWDMYGTGAAGTAIMDAVDGNIYTSVKYLPVLSTVDYIDIYMANLELTQNLDTSDSSIKIYFNGSSTEWAEKSITRGDIAKGYKRIEVNKPYVHSIQLEIVYSENVIVGSTDFSPSVAVVTYEPSTDNG